MSTDIRVARIRPDQIGAHCSKCSAAYGKLKYEFMLLECTDKLPICVICHEPLKPINTKAPADVAIV